MRAHTFLYFSSYLWSDILRENKVISLKCKIRIILQSWTEANFSWTHTSQSYLEWLSSKRYSPLAFSQPPFCTHIAQHTQKTSFWDNDNVLTCLQSDRVVRFQLQCEKKRWCKIWSWQYQNNIAINQFLKLQWPFPATNTGITRHDNAISTSLNRRRHWRLMYKGIQVWEVDTLNIVTCRPKGTCQSALAECIPLF